MRVPLELAQQVAQKRYLYLKELILYHGGGVSTLHRALVTSIQSHSCYMEHVGKVKELDEAKFEAMLNGKRDIPAYMAQSALDAILAEGYAPVDEKERDYLVLMLLTRRSVVEVTDIQRWFPQLWSREYGDTMLTRALLLVE